MARTGTLTTLCILISVLAMPLSAMAKNATPQIKCWTDKDGTRECGNVVPPEYSQQQSTTVNNQGIVTGVTSRAKTQEELEKEKAAQEAAAQRVAAEKEKQEKQAAYDSMLLATFTTEDDIVRSRDRKASAIDATIEVTNATIGNLQKKLDELKQRAAAYERNGKPVSDDIKSDMDSVQQQIAEKQKYIDYSKQQKEALMQQYAAYLARFRELKATPQQSQ